MAAIVAGEMELVETPDLRALSYLLSVSSLSDLTLSGGTLFKKDGDFAKSQGLAGKHFDADKLWALLQAKLKKWRQKGFSVRYSYGVRYATVSAGRLIADCGFQSFPRVIRATLASGVYWDLDMKNSQPVLMQQLCSKLEIETPCLTDYVTNRDQRLVQTAVTANVTTEEAKSMYIAVICGASANTVKKWPLPLRQLSAEVGGVASKLWDTAEYAPVRAIVQEQYDLKVKHQKPGKDVWDNRRGSLLAVVLQTEERKVLLAIKTSLEAQERTVHTLMHDGCHVLRLEGEDVFPEPILRSAEAAVISSLSYSIALAVKNFSESVVIPDTFQYVAGVDPVVELPVVGKRKRGRPKKIVPAVASGQIVDGVTEEQYLSMKALWEKTHFYWTVTNTYVEVSDHGLRPYELKHAQEYFGPKWHFRISDKFGDTVSFLDLWRKDPTRLCIRMIDFKPSTDPEVFYMPIKFGYESVPSPESPAQYVDIFKRLVDVVSGNDPACRDWFVKYLAHILQKPLDLPGVAVILTGQKGVGKDTLLDFMREHVIGKVFSHNYTETRQFFDKHDPDRKDKIFIKMEDSDDALCKTFAKDLRARVTGREGTVNPKGRDPITFPNYARYFFTANQAVPVGINDDNDRERRFVIFAVSNELKGDHAFWDNTYKTLFTAEGGRAVADYLLSVDIAEYQPRKHPKNEYQENLYEAERSPEQRFVEDGWNGEEVSSTQLFKMFQSFCSDNGFPKWSETAIGFGQRLAYFVMQKKVLKRIGRKKTAFYRKAVQDPADMDEEDLNDMLGPLEQGHGAGLYTGGAGAGSGSGGFFSTTTIGK